MVKKSAQGGIVAGHDYIDRFNDIEFGVKQAVGEWIAENKIPYLFLLKNFTQINVPAGFT